MSERFLNRRNIYTALSFIIPFAAYLLTLAPSISYVDTDELATAASLLKIAHPTGYPLFTVLGKVFTIIPAWEEVYMLNLMSAIVSSTAIALFFNLMVFIFSEFRLNKSDKSVADSIPLNVIYNISISSALILAFSQTFWDISNVVEVYSLHSLFLILLINIFLRSVSYYEVEDDYPFKREKYILLFAFILGLSFANHLTTSFLLPGMLYLYFSEYGFSRKSFKWLLYMTLLFALGLTMYAYLFVRADDSILSWGHTFTLDNFIAHVTGRQYNTAMFRSFEDVKYQLSRFFEQYPGEFVFLNVFLIVPGLTELFRSSRKLFYFMIILFATCILIAANYNIFDIYSYFLLALIVTSVWIGFGLIYILRSIPKIRMATSYGLLLLFLLPLSVNYSKSDKNGDYMVKDYVFNLFNSAPENSIIISNYNPTYYFQYVKKVRPDLMFINRDFLYNKWYLNSIINKYPDIYSNTKIEFDKYSEEVDKLHSNKSRYLAPQTQADFNEIMNFHNALKELLDGIIEWNYRDRGVYTTVEIDEVNDEKFAEPYVKVPNGVLLKLNRLKDVSDYKEVDLQYSVNHDDDFFKSYIMKNYYKAGINEAKYLMEISSFDKAVLKLEKALEIVPGSQEAQQLLVQVNQLRIRNK